MAKPSFTSQTTHMIGGGPAYGWAAFQSHDHSAPISQGQEEKGWSLLSLMTVVSGGKGCEQGVSHRSQVDGR